jgi:hypothetical protein
VTDPTPHAQRSPLEHERDTPDLTPEAVADLVKRASKAVDGTTPGPWAYNAHREVGPLHTEDDQAFGMICNAVCEVNFDADHLGNARFIAASRDLVPDMVATLRTLAAENVRLRAVIADATDPDFIEGAIDNVHDMDVTLRDYAEAVVRAVRGSAEIRALTPPADLADRVKGGEG